MSTTSLMTFAEFEQLPDSTGKQELIDGEVVQLPPPVSTNTLIAKWLYDLLLRTTDPGRVLFEAGYRIAGGWLQPDVSVLWPEQKMFGQYWAGGPALANEVLSTANTAAQMGRKSAAPHDDGLSR